MKARSTRSMVWLMAFLLPLLLACSGGKAGPAPTPAPAPPVISAFTASPATITAGQVSTLSWSVSGASALSIDHGIGAVSGASVTVSPGLTTTYTLTASNGAGSVTATATVTVNPGPPVIGAFTASPATITAGQLSTLSWSVSGASALSIDHGIGAVSGTSVTVSPGLTTTYTLTASNGAGTLTATATVTVNPGPPVIGAFTASPATITAGQLSTLSWSVSGASALSIDHGIGAVSGTSVTVSPNLTTTYTLTASNGAGTVTATATVTVNSAGPITTIEVTDTVQRPGVRRFGINIATNTYYDARQLSKELLFRNPGFEGFLFQSLIRVGSGTATSATEDSPYCQWPTGFWNGASYEVVYGSAKGRSGRVASSSARTASVNYTVNFAESGSVPATGDYLLLRKTVTGGDSAAQGWWVATSGGGSILSERMDLPPGTQGAQCVRLEASGAGQSATLYGRCDTMNVRFVLLQGQHRLRFKAKGLEGSRNLSVLLHRGANSFVSRNLNLGSAWADYEFSFSAQEGLDANGMIELALGASGSSVLIDDVSLTRLDGDPTNPTAFRDPVLAALRLFRPGILRGSVDTFGDSLDNLIAPPFARMRAGYSSYATGPTWDLSVGLHETLELAAAVGAEPWINFPMATSPEEMLHLMEYLGGPPGTPYGSRRAARGQAEPWSTVFPRIHLEFGNENWNSFYKGGVMAYPQAYGSRGHELFSVARTSPHYAPDRFDFVLGAQATNPGIGQQVAMAGNAHDSISLAPYMAYRVDSFASNEELFGPLFAESEWWSLDPASPMLQNANNLRSSGKNLSIYEVNLHTTMGTISQQALDAFTPSLGAGLGVSAHMLTMLKELGIRDQVFFALGGYSATRDDGKVALIWGGARDMGVTNRKRPQFLALQMLNGILGGDLLRTVHRGQDPTWNQPLMNRVQRDNCHHIQSFAFLEGGRLRIAVFNLHRSDSLAVNFSGSHAPRGAITLQRLASANLTDNNETAETVRIQSSNLAEFDPSAPLLLPPHSLTILAPTP